MERHKKRKTERYQEKGREEKANRKREIKGKERET